MSYRHINYDSSFADEIISREERGEESKIMLVITEIGPAPHTDCKLLGKQGLVSLEDMMKNLPSKIRFVSVRCHQKLQSIAI